MAGTTMENPMPDSKSDSDLVNEFADYFSNKILKIRESLDQYKKYDSRTYDLVPPLRQFKELSEEQVKKCINSMATKSCELDVIPMSLLKQMLPTFLPHITKIVNTSLKTEVFVESWKEAIVRPLLKKAGLGLINSNYRPVSNLSFVSEVLEKCALDQFTEHCDKYGLIPSYQSAYRPMHSCETALVKLVNDSLWTMESKEISAMVLIDLSAAFDTVDHELLLQVLSHRFGVGR